MPRRANLRLDLKTEQPSPATTHRPPAAQSGAAGRWRSRRPRPRRPACAAPWSCTEGCGAGYCVESCPGLPGGLERCSSCHGLQSSCAHASAVPQALQAGLGSPQGHAAAGAQLAQSVQVDLRHQQPRGDAEEPKSCEGDSRGRKAGLCRHRRQRQDARAHGGAGHCGQGKSMDAVVRSRGCMIPALRAPCV